MHYTEYYDGARSIVGGALVNNTLTPEGAYDLANAFNDTVAQRLLVDACYHLVPDTALEGQALLHLAYGLHNEYPNVKVPENLCRLAFCDAAGNVGETLNHWSV